MVIEFSRINNTLKRTILESMVEELYGAIMVLEVRILDSKSLGLEASNKQFRTFLLTRSEDGGHSFRIKISERGNNTANGKTISIGMDNGKVVLMAGSLKEIDMNNEEFEMYRQVYIRNFNLFKFCYDNNINDKYLVDTFVEDEIQRNKYGKVITRNPANGSYNYLADIKVIYNKGKQNEYYIYEPHNFVVPFGKQEPIDLGCIWKR